MSKFVEEVFVQKCHWETFGLLTHPLDVHMKTCITRNDIIRDELFLMMEKEITIRTEK